MLAVNYSTIRENLKAYCDRVTDNNETVIVTRKGEKNVVIISLEEWNELQRAARNAEYLAKLNRAVADLGSGRVVTKTLDEFGCDGGMNNIIFAPVAWDEYLYWQMQDKKTLRRINQLLRDIARDPFGGIGKPEPLKGDYAGFWSRRIDDSNRLIYRINDGILEILSCKGHYED